MQQMKSDKCNDEYNVINAMQKIQCNECNVTNAMKQMQCDKCNK